MLWDGGAKLPTKTKFDGILVDAPCSGVGTWQRNPQGRWTTELQDVKELAEVQKQLLANAAAALKPGGRLIYSVCTLTRSETTEVAEAITERFADLKPLDFKNPFKPKGAGGKCHCGFGHKRWKGTGCLSAAGRRRRQRHEAS